MILWAAKKEKKKKKKSWLAAGSRENKQTQGRGQDKTRKQSKSKAKAYRPGIAVLLFLHGSLYQTGWKQWILICEPLDRSR